MALAAAVREAKAIKDETLSQDPEPKRGPGRPRGSTRGKAPAAAGKTAPTKAQMIDTVFTEAYAVLSMLVGAWDMKDPDCAGVMTETVKGLDGRERERLEAIVTTGVKMLARNDTLLATFAKGGLLAEALLMASYVLPVGKQIWAAHGPNGTGHRPAEEISSEYARQFPAPSLA